MGPVDESSAAVVEFDEARILDPEHPPRLSVFDTVEDRFTVQEAKPRKDMDRVGGQMLPVAVAVSSGTPERFLDRKQLASRFHETLFTRHGASHAGPYAPEPIRDVAEDQPSEVRKRVRDERIRCRHIATRQDG